MDARPPERELRVGQVYQERKKVPVRYVQLVIVDRDDGTITMVRIGPAPPQALGRRTVRNIDTFIESFTFVYEERIDAYCSKCRREIKSRHYPDRIQSEHRSADGSCFNCSRRSGGGR